MAEFQDPNAVRDALTLVVLTDAALTDDAQARNLLALLNSLEHEELRLVARYLAAMVNSVYQIIPEDLRQKSITDLCRSMMDYTHDHPEPE